MGYPRGAIKTIIKKIAGHKETTTLLATSVSKLRKVAKESGYYQSAPNKAGWIWEILTRKFPLIPTDKQKSAQDSTTQSQRTAEAVRLKRGHSDLEGPGAVAINDPNAAEICGYSRDTLKAMIAEQMESAKKNEREIIKKELKKELKEEVAQMIVVEMNNNYLLTRYTVRWGDFSSIAIIAYSVCLKQAGKNKNANVVKDKAPWLEEMGAEGKIVFVDKSCDALNYDLVNLKLKEAAEEEGIEFKRDTKEKILNRHLYKQIVDFQMPHLRCIDSHDKLSFGGYGIPRKHRPDLIFTANLEDISAVNPDKLQIVATWEVKAEKLTDSHKGQLMCSLAALMALQSPREWMMGILSNTEKVMFIRLIWHGQDCRYHYSYELTKEYSISSPNDTGSKLLSAFLSKTPKDLGWYFPTFFVNNIQCTPRRQLGTGRTASVYRVLVNNTNMAVKVFNHNYMPYAAIEKKNLTRFSDQDIPGMPKFITDGETDQGLPYIVTTPVCDRIRSSGECPDLGVIVKLLKTIHNKGIVHRDISDSNIMRIDSMPYLIDWGTAADSNVVLPYSGTQMFASRDVLLCHADNKPVTYEPKHDLISLVHVFIRFHIRDKDLFTLRQFYSAIVWKKPEENDEKEGNESRDVEDDENKIQSVGPGNDKQLTEESEIQSTGRTNDKKIPWKPCLEQTAFQNFLKGWTMFEKDPEFKPAITCALNLDYIGLEKFFNRKIHRYNWDSMEIDTDLDVPKC